MRRPIHNQTLVPPTCFHYLLNHLEGSRAAESHLHEAVLSPIHNQNLVALTYFHYLSNHLDQPTPVNFSLVSQLPTIVKLLTQLTLPLLMSQASQSNET